jgi:hypothetical protein
MLRVSLPLRGIILACVLCAAFSLQSGSRSSSKSVSLSPNSHLNFQAAKLQYKSSQRKDFPLHALDPRKDCSTSTAVDDEKEFLATIKTMAARRSRLPYEEKVKIVMKFMSKGEAFGFASFADCVWSFGKLGINLEFLSQLRKKDDFVGLLEHVSRRKESIGYVDLVKLLTGLGDIGYCWNLLPVPIKERSYQILQGNETEEKSVAVFTFFLGHLRANNEEIPTTVIEAMCATVEKNVDTYGPNEVNILLSGLSKMGTVWGAVPSGLKRNLLNRIVQSHMLMLNREFCSISTSICKMQTAWESLPSEYRQSYVDELQVRLPTLNNREFANLLHAMSISGWNYDKFNALAGRYDSGGSDFDRGDFTGVSIYATLSQRLEATKGMSPYDIETIFRSLAAQGIGLGLLSQTGLESLFTELVRLIPSMSSVAIYHISCSLAKLEELSQTTAPMSLESSQLANQQAASGSNHIHDARDNLRMSRVVPERVAESLLQKSLAVLHEFQADQYGPLLVALCAIGIRKNPHFGDAANRDGLGSSGASKSGVGVDNTARLFTVLSRVAMALPTRGGIDVLSALAAMGFRWGELTSMIIEPDGGNGGSVTESLSYRLLRNLSKNMSRMRHQEYADMLRHLGALGARWSGDLPQSLKDKIDRRLARVSGFMTYDTMINALTGLCECRVKWEDLSQEAQSEWAALLRTHLNGRQRQSGEIVGQRGEIVGQSGEIVAICVDGDDNGSIGEGDSSAVAQQRHKVLQCMQRIGIPIEVSKHTSDEIVQEESDVVT